jgi:acetyl-CoA acetyltransferase
MSMGLSMADISVLKLNEAFAAQALAVTRALNLPGDSEKVNPMGVQSRWDIRWE